jgi:predicted ATPase/DNA-binding winged helix-turn-helix (wHTH) protein
MVSDRFLEPSIQAPARSGPPTEPLVFGHCRVLPVERQLFVNGQASTIGSRAFDVLLALIERRDRVVSKGELLDLVWPQVVVEENNLQVHISALRKLLGPEVIATVPGRGYRFAVRLDADRVPVHAAEAAVAVPKPASPAPAPAAATTNLPDRLPEIFGREEALAELSGLLENHALVTVVGPGGIGKTRLAQAVAHGLRNAYPQGVWMVELASLADASLVLPTIANVLQIAMPGHLPPLEELVGALHSQSLLLVLDNCEHLLDAVSPLALGLHRDAPGVRLLATSQQLFRLPQEQLYRLLPLAVPEHCAPSLAANFGAVRLLVERVRALDARFDLNADNTGAVIDICNGLDGIALAIELAAARVPLLGVEGVRERLDQRLQILSVGARGSLPRHQTLRAALEWSHQLLDGEEQILFRRLSVFVGGFTVESAQRVTGDEATGDWEVIDRLSSLVDKSLVLVDGGPRPRYRLLETTRSYALERLEEAGEMKPMQGRHAHAMLAVLERAIKRRDIELLVQEMNNIRTAFAWAAAAGDDRTALALATASSVVLAVEGFVTEALDRLLKVEHLANATMPPALVAQYWQWLGRLGVDGRLPVLRCIDALQRAEAMFAQQGNLRAEALLETHDLAASQATLDDARRMEEQNELLPLADRMRRLRVLGMLEDRLGRATESLATSERAFRLAESAGIERYVLILLADMAAVHLKLGHAAEAAQRFGALAERARAR